MGAMQLSRSTGRLGCKDMSTAARPLAVRMVPGRPRVNPIMASACSSSFMAGAANAGLRQALHGQTRRSVWKGQLPVRCGTHPRACYHTPKQLAAGKAALSLQSGEEEQQRDHP
jgi:hypothetical protein